MAHIVITGNVVDGHTFTGPFATAEEALEYGERQEEWRMVELQPAPAEEPRSIECPVCGRDGAVVDPTGAATNTPLYHCRGCGLKWYFGS